MYFDSGLDLAGVMAKTGFEAFGITGVGASEKWLGVFGWDEEPKRERYHFEGGSSTGEELDSVVEEGSRDVDEDADVKLEVSSAPEEVMSVVVLGIPRTADIVGSVSGVERGGFAMGTTVLMVRDFLGRRSGVLRPEPLWVVCSDGVLPPLGSLYDVERR